MFPKWTENVRNAVSFSWRAGVLAPQCDCPRLDSFHRESDHFYLNQTYSLTSLRSWPSSVWYSVSSTSSGTDLTALTRELMAPPLCLFLVRLNTGDSCTDWTSSLQVCSWVWSHLYWFQSTSSSCHLWRIAMVRNTFQNSQRLTFPIKGTWKPWAENSDVRESLKDSILWVVFY